MKINNLRLMSFDVISRKAATINFALDVRSVTTYLGVSGDRKRPYNGLDFIGNSVFSGNHDSRFLEQN